MTPILCICASICGYLLGGLNPAIILSKAIYHQDIRSLGSGNPGFTNFKRVFGNNAVSWLVLFLDMAKTAIPVCLFAVLFRSQLDMWQLGAALTGFACMLGHSYPLQYKFRGGKSFIAGFTTIWFVDYRVGIVFFVVFMILLFVSKYMSLASLVSTAMYPITLAFFGFTSPWVEVLAILSALLVIWRHKANIKRLIDGTESKFNFR